MSTKIKAFQLVADVVSKGIDWEDRTAYVDLEISDGDFTGGMTLESNSDDIDSLFSLGCCYELELRCHPSNDPHNEWPVTTPVEPEQDITEYVKALESVAEAAENVAGYYSIFNTPNHVLVDLIATVDHLKRVRDSHGY